jgi:hypothetical protein
MEVDEQSYFRQVFTLLSAEINFNKGSAFVELGSAPSSTKSARLLPGMMQTR